MKNVIFTIFGIIFFIIGTIGLIIPIIPQIPFFVISILFFASASKKIRKIITTSKIYRSKLYPHVVKHKHIHKILHPKEEENNSNQQ